MARMSCSEELSKRLRQYCSLLGRYHAACSFVFVSLWLFVARAPRSLPASHDSVTPMPSVKECAPIRKDLVSGSVVPFQV